MWLKIKHTDFADSWWYCEPVTPCLIGNLSRVTNATLEFQLFDVAIWHYLLQMCWTIFIIILGCTHPAGYRLNMPGSRTQTANRHMDEARCFCENKMMGWIGQETTGTFWNGVGKVRVPWQQRPQLSCSAPNPQSHIAGVCFADKQQMVNKLRE